MFRGLLAGVVWGGLASVFVLALVSFLAPPLEEPRVGESPAALDAPEPDAPDGSREETLFAPPAGPDTPAPVEEDDAAPDAPETEGRQPHAPETAPAPEGVTAPDPHEEDAAPEVAARPDAPADGEARIGPLSALDPDAMPSPAEGTMPRPQVQDSELRLDADPDSERRDTGVDAPGPDGEIAAATPEVRQHVAPDAAPDDAMQDGAPAPAPQVDAPRGPDAPADVPDAAPSGPDRPAHVEDERLQADAPSSPAMPPAGSDAPPAVVFPQIAPDADPAAPPAAPQTDPESDPAQTVPDSPQVGLTPVPGVETMRLPRIGDEPAERNPDADRAALPEAEADGPGEPLPALRRNAADFDNPDDRPLFAVIVMDDGISAQDQTRLARLPFPATIAVDPTLPDAAERAALYREGGKEVLMLVSAIPQGATASDLEVTFQSHFNALPGAVGVLDLPEGGFQNDRLLSEQVITVIADDGYGVVTFDHGMNAAEQVARSTGLGTERVFRILDAEDEQAATIRRYLDRAVFRAAQRGSVIVLGGSSEETLAGILEWRMEGRADAVALAPVSAVLIAAQ